MYIWLNDVNRKMIVGKDLYTLELRGNWYYLKLALFAFSSILTQLN